MKAWKITLGVLALWASASALAQTSPLIARKLGAPLASNVSQTPVNGIEKAGSRLVAVGARGLIALSDDAGKSWRQAKQVPVASTLNAVSFINDKRGWAVGHNGVILATDNGGDTWSIQRWDESKDQPLFSVMFTSPEEGYAVGLWSLALRTTDGGKSWMPIELPVPPTGAKKDLNFFKVFGGKSQVYISAEAGWLLKSTDDGKSWTYRNVGGKASLWAGYSQASEVWVGGLQGKVFHSVDAGSTWKPVETGMKASVTSIRQGQDSLLLVGLDGNVAESKDSGKTFHFVQRSDRASVTDAVQLPDQKWLLSSGLGALAR